MKKFSLTSLGLVCAGLISCSSVPSSIAPTAGGATVAAVSLPTAPEDAFETGLTEEDLIDEPLGSNGVSAVSVSDPLRPVNRAIHGFNDGFYDYVMRPASRGYNAAMPDPVQRGLSNAFANLRFPQRFAGNLLQGKFDAASKESRKFVLNSTAGVLGFWKVSARVPSLNTSPEDFGQTLGAWGIPHGAYLVLPFIGPSTLRDAVGQVADGYAYPVNYIDPAEIALGARGLQILNDSESILDDYDALKSGAIDFYESLKDGYIQNRNRLTSQ